MCVKLLKMGVDDMEEKIEKVAKRYAESIVLTKFLDNVTSRCAIAAGVVGVGAIIAGAALSAWIIPLGLLISASLGLVSLTTKVLSNKQYDKILENDMSKKEFKNLVRNGEMKKYLQQILSNKNSNVQTIEKLDAMLNGEIKTPLGGRPLMNSVKKEIYGKDKPKDR